MQAATDIPYLRHSISKQGRRDIEIKWITITVTRIKNRKTPKGNKSKGLNKMLPKENKEPPEDELNKEPSISRQNLKPL